MAAALKERFGVDATLIEGGGGIFDVRLDDELIFSKHEQDRFPTNEEIVGLIDSRKS